MKDLGEELRRREAEGLYRRRMPIDGPPGVEPVIDGQRLLAFCSNDYLGLAGHPEVARALGQAAARYGTGAGAAHLVTGHTRAHHALEEDLAAFVGRPRALVFSTGYMANLGLVGALAGRGDAVFQDRLNHASLLDAARLAGARLVRYGHGDAADLARRLARRPDGERVVATDGVFSMDGDLAPLPGLVQAAGDADAWLVVDDAHGLGVLGSTGRGILEHFGLGMDQVPVLVGTLGKAFGTFGAFVAGSAELVEYLIQRARSYIYTTAPPPALAEATRVSLQLADAEPWRRAHLFDLVERFRTGARQLDLPLASSTTPIQPLILGATHRALAWQAGLRRRGIVIGAMRPPTVPEGTARLRITLSAAHTEAHVERLLEALAAVRGELGAAHAGDDG